MNYYMEWGKAALVRAVRTFAQALAAQMGSGAVGITELSWPQMLSIAAAAAVLSLLTSLGGLPEVN